MISLVGFLLVLGLIVFGPKKTIEFALEIGRLLAQLKQATGQFQQSHWLQSENLFNPP
jgi:Sec-independent protein translocase protein TatA